MEKKTMSTPVANANNLSVHFIGEGNVPSVYVDGRILSPQTVVYIISVGGVRSVNNLPPRGMTYNRPNGSVVTVIDAIVQRLLLERPVVCNIGASWVVRSNSVVVSASAAAFEGFTISGSGLAIYGNETYFECKSIVETLATGRADPNDLTVNGAELGQTIKVQLPNGSSATFSDWLLTGTSFTGFQIKWEGPPMPFYVYDQLDRYVEGAGDRWMGSPIKAITFYDPTPKTLDVASADVMYGQPVTAW